MGVSLEWPVFIFGRQLFKPTNWSIWEKLAQTPVLADVLNTGYG